MIASAHLIVGAAAGLAVQNNLPLFGLVGKGTIGFLAGVVSHLLLDAVVHGEYPVQGYKLGLVLLLELVFVFALIFTLPRSSSVNLVIFLAMFGAALPDLFHLIHDYLIGWKWLMSASQVIHLFHGKIFLGFEINFFFQFLISFAGLIILRSCRL